MKIAIDIRSTLKISRTGIGQYTCNLIKNLAGIDRENKYSLYAKLKFFSKGKKLPIIKAKNFNFKIDRFGLGLDKILGKQDIYHTPSQDLVDLPGSRLIVTVHDLIFKTFPLGQSKEAIADSEKRLLNVISKADRIICYSRSTIYDLKSFYNVPEEKIVFIPLGVDIENFSVMDEKDRIKGKKILEKLGVKKYILFVGTLEPRKNIGNLILAFDKLKKEKNIGHKLLIVGMKGWAYENIFDLYGKSPFKNDIMFLGYQPNESLKSFYNLADVFVFPSFYEGFGFPIVEAYSCGCPVVTSDVSSCKEIAEGAALTVNPNNVEEISGQIFKIISDNKLSLALREKGLEKSKNYSWEQTAKKTLELYKEAYSQ